MIPTNILKVVIRKLTEETMQGKTQWHRERQDREYFKLNRGPVAFIIRSHEARVQESTVQFIVADQLGNDIGSLIASEDDKESYELLSTLVFAVQLRENSRNFTGIINELLKMLPETEREQWGGKP